MRYATPAAGLFLSFLSATATAVGCAPAEVDEPSTERFEACLEAYECGIDCPSPTELLTDYPCFRLDDSEPPACETEFSGCKEEKDACFLQCETDCGFVDGSPPDPLQCTEDEVRNCKLACRDAEAPCEEEFEAWLAGRSDVIQDFRTCLRPCEGGNSRQLCAEDPPTVYCDAVDAARHLAITNIDECESSGGTNDKACNFDCESSTNGFSQP